MSGWIKIHRKIRDWEWYDDANTMRVFIHCLVSANWRAKIWRGFEIERGSFFSSYEKIGEELRLSKQQVRTSLKKLKSTQEITLKATRNGLLLTVSNYASYNDINRDDQHAETHACNTVVTLNQHSFNTLVTPTKEEEEEEQRKQREKKNRNSVFDFSIPPEIPESLKGSLVKWQSHRREIKKPLTATAWDALIADCVKSPATMEDAINKSILSGWQGLFPNASKSPEPEPAKTKPKTLPANWREIGQLRYGRDFTGVEIEQLTYDEFGDIQRDCRFYANNPDHLAVDQAAAKQLSPL
jgi:hypothetical protein